MERQTEYIPVMLTPSERAKLVQIAQEAGRSQGAVLRRLLTLADLPQARELLGLPKIVEQEENP